MIRAIARRGVTILMIEHVMQAVMSLTEQVYVLSRRAASSRKGPPPAVARDPRRDRGLSRSRRGPPPEAGDRPCLSRSWR